MANTMFSSNPVPNLKNLVSNFRQFRKNVLKSGKTPETLLDEVMKDGRYTKADLEKAKKLANLFAGYFK